MTKIEIFLSMLGLAVTYYTYRSSRWRVLNNRQEWLNDLRRSIAILLSKNYEFIDTFYYTEIRTSQINEQNYEEKLKLLYKNYQSILETIIYCELLLANKKSKPSWLMKKLNKNRIKSNELMTQLNKHILSIRLKIPKFTHSLRSVMDRNMGKYISPEEVKENDIVANFNLNKNIAPLVVDLNEIDKIIKELVQIEWVRIKKGV